MMLSTFDLATASDTQWDNYCMAHALKLARQGWYTTAPNPRVGCVITRNRTIVGEGWHQKSGEAHAEIIALAQAQQQARGACVYLTLEPCAHQGKTPPCANALIKAGIKRLVVAMEDPNPLVAGQGLERCRQAGIEVIVGIGAREANALNLGFISRMTKKRPYIRLKMAMSLDGRTAMRSGESQWITGQQSHRQVQRLRAQTCAIMSGVDTLIQDDSRLTVRADETDLPIEDISQPLRVIVDSRLRMPLAARMLREPGKTLIVTRSDNLAKQQLLKQASAEILQQQASEINENVHDKVDLLLLMQTLASRYQCNEVLVETGAGLAGALFKAHLVDEIILFVAPILIGSNARALFELDYSVLAQRQALTIETIRAVGQDWMIIAKPNFDLNELMR